jgi:serine/threonine-protein kinase
VIYFLSPLRFGQEGAKLLHVASAAAAAQVFVMESVQPGLRLDRYYVESVIAEGGMATIFRGWDPRSERLVALKVPRIEAESDVVFYERFRREEQIGQTLEHPGIVKVFPNDGRSRVYMVMEWVEGESLRTLLCRRPALAPERAVRIALQICDALEYLHRHRVIHRDLKPENIIVDAGDHIKLIDFGIAGSAGARRLTFGKFSQIMGTPDYISPEQVQGKRGDARSDLFALGVMLYEMLTGKAPFRGPNPLAIMNDRLQNSPRPPREINPAIPPQLQAVILRALARDPRRRYASAGNFAYALEHLDEVDADETAPAYEAMHPHLSQLRDAIFFAPLALIPAILFTLLICVTRHG